MEGHHDSYLKNNQGTTSYNMFIKVYISLGLTLKNKGTALD